MRGFLDQHLVGPWREVEARIAESPWPGTTHRIQPHVLSDARRILRKSGELVELSHTTHGDRQVELVCTGSTLNRRRAIADATSRKAKLYGRYLSWAQGPLTEDYPSGVTGLAGERVLRASIRSQLNGITPVGNPGDVRTLFGHTLDGGSYDDAAYLVTLDDTSTPVVVTLVFEMKNVRRWLYPDDDEVHKLLYRSARLQEAQPNTLVCPVLVCRRRHARAIAMGKQLGFYAIQTGIHFVLDTARIDLRKFEEVRSEAGLAFTDMVLQSTASPRLVRVLDKSLRRDALTTAMQWRKEGSQYTDHYDRLRRPLGYQDRADSMSELRHVVADQLDEPVTW